MFGEKKSLLSKITAVTLVTFFNSSTPVLAQTVRYVPPPPPNLGQATTVGRQRSGGNRGDCPVASEPLTALVPATRQQDNRFGTNPAFNTWESVWGLSSTASPTIFFYLPYKLTSKFPATFILQDEQGKNIYKSSSKVVQSQPSIVGIHIPSKAVQLQPGKRYHWYFFLDCDTDSPPIVDGWLQHTAINPTLRKQLQKASPRQQVALYAANGLWYDALNTLAQLRQKRPEDPLLSQDWRNLLRSVGLEAIAAEPLSSCCSLTAIKRR